MRVLQPEVAQSAARFLLVFLFLVIPFSKSAIEVTFPLLLVTWGWGWLKRRQGLTLWSMRPGRFLLAALGVYLAICTFSVLVSSYPWLSLRGLIRKTLEYALFFLIACEVAASRSEVSTQSIRALFVSCVVVVLWSFLQQHTVMLQLSPYDPISGRYLRYARMVGPYENPNDLATFLMVVMVLLTASLMGPSSRWKWLKWVLWGSLWVCLGMTQSFGALLGIFAGFVTLWLLTPKRWGFWAGMAVAFALCLAFGFSREGHLAQMLTLSDAASQERMLMWRAGWRMIQDHPIVGVGLNTFMANYLSYADTPNQGPAYAHNCFLQAAAETGLFGLLSFLLFLAALLFLPSRASPLVVKGVLAAVVAFLVQSGLDTNLYALRQAVLFWTLSGLLVGSSVRLLRATPAQALAGDPPSSGTGDEPPGGTGADPMRGSGASRPRSSLRRWLLVRTDRMGDLLLTLPALHEIRKAFPRAEIHLLVQKGLEPLVEGHWDLDRVDSWDPLEGNGCLAAWRLSRRLRRERYDGVVIFNPTKLFHLASFLAGIPIRVGYRRKLGILLTHSLPDTKHLRGLHEAEYNLELIGRLGIQPGPKAFALKVDPQADRQAQEILKSQGLDPSRPPIAIHPWTSNPSKAWPLESFQRLFQRLWEMQRPLVVLGGPEEVPQMGALRRFPKTADFVGKVPLTLLPALLKHCAVLISNDSGPVHVSAAVGTPTIVVAPEGHAAGLERWRPLGDGHRILFSPTVEQALAALDQLGQAARPAQRIRIHEA